MSAVPDRLSTYPSIGRLVDRVLAAWPEHAGFVARVAADLQDDELAPLEALAADILAVAAGRLDRIVEGYRWTCERINAETLEFMRTGRYRCATIAEADAEIYSQPEIMRGYLDGLLLSQLLWANHARAWLHFAAWMGDATTPFDYLEIGPGHGLMLAQALRHPLARRAQAWDISPAALDLTGEALAALQLHGRAELVRQDVTAATVPDRFDRVVASEVLEHMERPADVLAGIAEVLRPGGQLFVNVPVNSPAPDHIYLLRTPEDAVALVEEAGFRVLRAEALPMTGYSLKRARSAAATISCVIVAEPR